MVIEKIIKKLYDGAKKTTMPAGFCDGRRYPVDLAIRDINPAPVKMENKAFSFYVGPYKVKQASLNLNPQFRAFY